VINVSLIEDKCRYPKMFEHQRMKPYHRIRATNNEALGWVDSHEKNFEVA